MVNTSNISQLDYTLDLVSGLSDEELKAVQSVALVFLKKIMFRTALQVMNRYHLNHRLKSSFSIG